MKSKLSLLNGSMLALIIKAFRYLCMSPERFEHLLTLVGPLISKKTTKISSPFLQQTVDPHLVFVGQWWWPTVTSFQLSPWIGRTTVNPILRETCSAIWTALGDIYIRPPSSPDYWRKIWNGFEKGFEVVGIYLTVLVQLMENMSIGTVDLFIIHVTIRAFLALH